MGVDKIIVRSILTTLAAIGVLLVVMVLSLCALFPSTMMEITYDLGMESSSIRFAERAYKWSDDVYYIAYATEVSIEEGKRDKITACGEKFLQDEHFTDYCEKQSAGYGEFICGKVCVSRYEQGDKTGAMDLAFASLSGDFPKNNAVVALLLTATAKGDVVTVAMIKDKLNALIVGEADQAYLNETLAFIG